MIYSHSNTYNEAFCVRTPEKELLNLSKPFAHIYNTLVSNHRYCVQLYMYRMDVHIATILGPSALTP